MVTANPVLTHKTRRLSPRGIWWLVKCSAKHWSADQAPTIGASLAFYCAFSLAPLLVIILTVAGWIVGAEAAFGQLSEQLTSLFGKATADMLDAIASALREIGKIDEPMTTK